MPDENTKIATGWYAAYTRPRWEKKVAQALAENGFDNYCPLNKVTRQWSDRKKIVLEPVFKGYIFIRVPEEKKWEIKKISGILNYVFWLGRPAVIQDKEIIVIKKFLNEFDDVAVEKRPVGVNSSVRIVQGIFMNYKGMVVEVFGNRAIVKIDTMDIQLSAHFDKKHLELVTGYRH